MHLVPDPLILIIQLAPFLFLVLVLNSWVFNPLLNYLEERQHRIDGYSKEAKSIQENADRQMAQVENKMAEARATAANLRGLIIREAENRQNEIVEAARAAANAKTKEYRLSLEKEKLRAKRDLDREIEVLSNDIASRILGRTLP